MDPKDLKVGDIINKYTRIIRTGMDESGIIALILTEFSRGDLTLPLFIMTNCMDTRHLIHHFKSLASPPNINNDEALQLCQHFYE